MIAWLAISVFAALAFALLGRRVARRKHRPVFVWGLAAALFPPALLLLLALPDKPSPGA